jgi:hypothetical protein
MRPNNTNRVPIRVNCYDLYKTNTLMRNSRFALYHTSVVIDDRLEVDFGLRPGNGGNTAISVTSIVDRLSDSMDLAFYRTFPIGISKRSFNYCEFIINRFCADPRWASDRYNIIYNNCHTFAFLLTEALVGEGNVIGFPQFVFESDHFADGVYCGLGKRFFNERKLPGLLAKPPASQHNILESKFPRVPDTDFLAAYY